MGAQRAAGATRSGTGVKSNRTRCNQNNHPPESAVDHVPYAELRLRFVDDEHGRHPVEPDCRLLPVGADGAGAKRGGHGGIVAPGH